MIKRSISFVVRQPTDASRILAVRRPPDDDELPDAWGLPAGSLRAGETWADAVRRAGHEKLGVELDVGGVLEEGDLERDGYALRMRLYEARIARGEPRVPQAAPGVTQYTETRWATAATLEPAARAGSLCCRLYLRSLRDDGPDA